MPYTTVTSGDYITSAWANANVRDQVVTPFSTSGNRTTAITSPVAGMLSTLTTNTSTEGVYEYLSSNQWRAPWNLPWGVIALDTMTTNQSTTSTSFADVTGFVTASFTPVARRYYRISVSFLAFALANPAISVNEFQVVSTASSAVVLGPISQQLATTDYQTVSAVSYYANTATAATTYKVQFHTSASQTMAIAGATQAAVLIVEDMGPSGAPS